MGWGVYAVAMDQPNANIQKSDEPESSHTGLILAGVIVGGAGLVYLFYKFVVAAGNVVPEPNTPPDPWFWPPRGSDDSVRGMSDETLWLNRVYGDPAVDAEIARRPALAARRLAELARR